MKKLLTLVLSLFMAVSLCLTISAEDNYIAQIGETKYTNLETLLDAINSASGEIEVKILANIENNPNSITILENQNITIDLNGKTLSTSIQQNNNSKHYYALVNKGTLTIYDSSAEQTGKISSRGIDNYGTLTINSGTFESIDSGNGGAAVYNDGPKDGEETANLYINGGIFKVTNGQNDTSNGAVCLINNGDAFITGGKFESNSSKPGLYTVISTGSITITPAEGKEVIVSGIKGGLGIDGGSATINGGDYSANEAYGLYISNDYSKATVKVTDGKFDGGGKYLGIKTSVVIGSDREDKDGNKVEVDSTLEITGGTFKERVLVENNVVEGAVVISGGTYPTDVTKYLASGYNAVKTKDGDKDLYKVIKEGSQKVEVKDNTPALEEVAYDVVKESIDTSKITFDSSTKVVLETTDISESDFDTEQKEEATEKVLNEIKTNSDKVDTSTIGLIPLDISLYIYNNGQETASISKLNNDITVTLYLNEATLNKVKGKKIYAVRFHEEEGPEEKALANAINNKTEVTVLDATLTNNALSFKTNKFSTYVIAYGDYIPTKTYSYKDKNQDGIVDCSEEMNNANWIWSESKGACVYKVSNTGTK